MRDGEVLAALEITESRQERMQGLLDREGIDGAILIRPARSVHSVGMQFPLDVAVCDKDLVVLRTICLRPGRLTRPSLKGHSIIEAEKGAFDRWNLRPGDRLEIRE
ncbi:MAG TPA: DUF192 domain-containing protein [Acidimicrobiales bacterium]|nr:DUF192 domain-containing protein [Acidimicrobiales bacterium]